MIQMNLTLWGSFQSLLIVSCDISICLWKEKGCAGKIMSLMLFNRKHCKFFLTIDSLMFYSGFKNGRTANLFWEFARVSEERTGVLFLQVRSQHLKQFFLMCKIWKIVFCWLFGEANQREFINLLWFRENLSKDLYLMSQMDSDQFVPIWTIASMESIKVLTTDMDLILDVLRCKWKAEDGSCLKRSVLIGLLPQLKYS